MGINIYLSSCCKGHMRNKPRHWYFQAFSKWLQISYYWTPTTGLGVTNTLLRCSPRCWFFPVITAVISLLFVCVTRFSSVSEILWLIHVCIPRCYYTILNMIIKITDKLYWILFAGSSSEYFNFLNSHKNPIREFLLLSSFWWWDSP